MVNTLILYASGTHLKLSLCYQYSWQVSMIFLGLSSWMLECHRKGQNCLLPVSQYIYDCLHTSYEVFKEHYWICYQSIGHLWLSEVKRSTKNPFICLHVRYAFIIPGRILDVTNHPPSQEKTLQNMLNFVHNYKVTLGPPPPPPPTII